MKLLVLFLVVFSFPWWASSALSLSYSVSTNGSPLNTLNPDKKTARVSAATGQTNKRIFHLNDGLGRGINLSGLEQSVEGDWNFKLRNDAFRLIADGGFDSVRLPIKWDSRAPALGSSANANYPIDKAFFERIDEVVADALSVGLRVIINMHLYEDLINNPNAEANRFINLWDQIAKHYADQSDWLYFEILNEPAGVFIEQAQLWNTLQAKALQTIRASNPERAVLVAPVGWNLIERLPELQLPADENLIVSVHYYDPGQFTHQGAEWVEPTLPLGVKWIPLKQRLGVNLQNWSWDTDLRFNRDTVDVKYLRSGAALNIYRSPGVPLKSLSINVQGRLELAIICGSGGKFVDTQVRIKHNSKTWASYSAALTSCPDNSDQIAIQNVLEGERFLKLRGGELCEGQTCTALFLNNAEVIEQSFDRARDWGERHNRPMNLGEFGAYQKADMESRVRWTKVVQNAAVTRGFSSHYWEFEEGFGIWNREDASWRESLYRALIPSL